VLIGAGPEVDELVAEVNGNHRYHLEFKAIIDPGTLLESRYAEYMHTLEREKISLIVVDADHQASAPMLPLIYELAFVQQTFQYADFYRIYEEVFDRVPLSLLRYDWFLKNISRNSMPLYSFVKRVVDIIGALVMGIVTLIAIPVVYAAMLLEGPGPLFIPQVRLGSYGKRIRVYKFRSMSFNESASDAWVGESQNVITRVGKVLRLTSLDEFPQCINILRGHISLIGPRNDIEGLGVRLADAVPFYNIRYMVKPGITGWAQINQQYEPGNISPQSIEETKVRLAYDFYYIKNRSLALDLVIALKTFKRMFFRVSNW
jgi:lipopolysaccharide/colanic/teichoic acid biosynthesis glycosyltransferase